MADLRAVALFLACASLVACACALQPEGQPPDEEGGRRFVRAITHGQPDESVAHQAVVALQNVSDGGLCSGTLIAPRVVLTAAHCVSGGKARQFRVLFGQSVDQPQAVREVEELRAHPEYGRGETADIGLVRMTEPAPAGVSPIPYLPMSLALSATDVGATVRFVGFGKTEHGGSGDKLYVDDTIDYVCGAAGCDWAGPGEGAPYTVCYDQQPGGPCSGDSGGPALLGRDGKEYVAAVTSYGDLACEVYGCSTRVDFYEPFILEFAVRILGARCLLDEECESGMCSAGVCCQARCGVCQVCNLPGSVGSCRTAADGHPCPDAEPCNGGEVCQAGACVSGAPPRCDDDNPCTSDGCRAGTGCVHTALADGTRCSNGDVCDGEETCRAGVCKPGQPLGCDDGNPCTLDSCEPGKGCVSVRLADGTRCSNGDVCDGEEICQAGVCGPGRPLACDDANSCTTDSCHPLRGCQHARLADGTSCSGLDLCAGPGSCASGLCTGTGVRPLDCDDQNPCTTDTCRADAGCSHQAVADRTSCGDCLACAGGACLAAEDCAGGGGCALVGAAARHDRGWFWLLFWSVLLFACLLALLRARPARRWRRARPD